MEPAFLVALILLLLCSLLFIGYGIHNIRSLHPVGFYSGYPRPKDEDITDIRAYNLAHGKIWITYGAGLFLLFFLGLFPINGLLYVAMIALVMIGSIFPMIKIHNKLDKKYKRFL